MTTDNTIVEDLETTEADSDDRGVYLTVLALLGIGAATGAVATKGFGYVKRTFADRRQEVQALEALLEELKALNAPTEEEEED